LVYGAAHGTPACYEAWEDLTLLRHAGKPLYGGIVLLFRIILNNFVRDSPLILQ
jgi:hypothetical protein